MKKTAVLIFALFLFIGTYAQEISSSQIETASNYARTFAKNIMWQCDKFHNQRNLKTAIKDVSLYESNGSTKYKIELTISWYEGSSYENIYYEFGGTLIVDLYGSSGLFLINHKKEPAPFGIGVCSEELNADLVEQVKYVCEGAKWAIVINM